MGWLITLAVLAALAWLPLGATVRYDSAGLVVKIIAGPARIQLLPRKKAEKKEKPQKKKADAKPKAAPTKKESAEKEEKGGPITDFLPLVKTALDFLNAFRKKLRINHLYIDLILAGDDPCDLALNYGKANAAMGNLLPQLERCFVIRKRDIRVGCDFTISTTLILACGDLTITLGRLLAILVWYGVRALKQYLSIQNKRKGGIKHE